MWRHQAIIASSRALTRAARTLAGPAFALQFVVLDLVLARHRTPLYADGARVAGYVASAAFGALVFVLARTRTRQAALALASGIVFSVQATALHHFGTALDVHFVDSARAAWSDVRPVLVPLLARLGVAAALTSLVEAGLLAIGRRVTSRRFVAALGAVALVTLVGVTLGPGLDRAPPELRFGASLRGLFAKKQPSAVGTVTIEPLESDRRVLPRVLLVVTESVRASDYCSAPRSPCEVAPETNALFPDRIALEELRSLGSFTAVSVQVIASGQTQLGTKDQIALAPTFFDMLRAVRSPSRVFTSYHGAHYAPGVWERANMRAYVDRFVSQEELEDADATRSRDMVVVDRFEEFIRGQKGPLFAMLHVYGTHIPYYASAALSPFQPADDVASWATLGPLHNQYKNAILTQDHELARALRAFIATPGPWVVLFTSDHGEAFGEHHAIHHGQGLYDEQIHVPGFIAWGGGALAPAEIAHLRERATQPTSHMDILPTVLDLFGVWDAGGLVSLRPKLRGSSLLRAAPSPERPRRFPISNCTTSNPCPLNNWGVLGDHHMLAADVWDSAFHCVPLDDSGLEATPEPPECAALRAASTVWFPTLPNGSPNL